MARRPPAAAPRSVPRLVTLTTDIGWAYAAQMKAVLYRALPAGQVVDLAHDIPPHSVREGAFLLDAMARRFPAGTVHVAIVDPGVGSARAPIAIGCAEGSALVGPDNGVLSALARSLGRVSAVRLLPERIVPEAPRSATFEGRDLFAPAATLLAWGTRPSQLGAPIEPVEVDFPRPASAGVRWSGEVLHVDRFGNLITNLPPGAIEGAATAFALRLGRRRFRPTKARTYADLPAGGLGVLVSSFGTVEVSVREGSAADTTRAGVGDPVELLPAGRATRRG
jgi:S-adenosylmethionine hydrolase